MGLVVPLVRAEPTPTGPDADLAHVARRLREVRLSLGLSTDQLGAKIGIAGAYIEAVEAGRNRPSLPMVCHMAMHLGCRLRDLVP